MAAMIGRVRNKCYSIASIVRGGRVMDRQYYLAKLGIIVVAVAIAFAGSGMGTTHAAHGISAQSAYTASAQLQAAAWNATAKATRLIACLVSHSTQATY
jgi:hypothetical protein